MINISKAHRLSHGCSVRKNTSATKEYNAWCSMKKRCLNPKNPSYSSYGGRGIMVCDRWKDSFESFLLDMGPAPTNLHSVDRINVNGNYEPGNCRWATAIEQRKNQRPKQNEIYLNGEGTRQASRRLGGWKGLVYDRIRRGWSIVDAFTKPAKQRKKHEYSECA